MCVNAYHILEYRNTAIVRTHPLCNTRGWIQSHLDFYNDFDCFSSQGICCLEETTARVAL